MLNLQRELTKSIFLHNKKEKILITFSAGITAISDCVPCWQSWPGFNRSVSFIFMRAYV